MRTLSLFVVSWVLLLLLAGLITFGSVTSAMSALGKRPDALNSSYTVEQLETEHPDAAISVRARRVTAATWALAYSILIFCIVLVPYRRGERWAWWALLLSLGISQAISLARVLGLGTTQGAGVSGILLIVLVLALLAGVPRIFRREPLPVQD
jgi:hypothetical protein